MNLSKDQIYDVLVPAVCPLYEGAIELFAERTKNVDSVSDLGIGTGNIALKILEKNPHLSYLGFDHSEEALALLMPKVNSYNCQLSQADFRTVNLPNADVAISSLAIHHLSETEQYDLFRQIQEASDSFIHFEIIKARTESEARENEEYTLSRARQVAEELDLSFSEIKQLLEASSKHDKPLTIDDHLRIHENLDVELEILLQDYGFVMYQTFKKSK